MRGGGGPIKLQHIKKGIYKVAYRDFLLLGNFLSWHYGNGVEFLIYNGPCHR